MKTLVCTCMFVLHHILVLIVTRLHFDNANRCPRCVCVRMLTDLLSFRVLLIRRYIYIYEKTKTIRLINLHLDLLCVCVCMSFLLLMYTGGLIRHIYIKEIYLTL